VTRRRTAAAIRALGTRRRPGVIVAAAAVVLAVAGVATGAALDGFAGHEGHAGRGVGHHSEFLDDGALPGR
jgi:hypothetical protein